MDYTAKVLYISFLYSSWNNSANTDDHQPPLSLFTSVGNLSIVTSKNCSRVWQPVDLSLVFFEPGNRFSLPLEVLQTPRGHLKNTTKLPSRHVSVDLRWPWQSSNAAAGADWCSIPFLLCSPETLQNRLWDQWFHMMLHRTKKGICPINDRQQAYSGCNRDVLDFGYGISFSYSSIKKKKNWSYNNKKYNIDQNGSQDSL